jgi:putative Mg2+ transporter-C (MgtC) family protein
MTNAVHALERLHIAGVDDPRQGRPNLNKVPAVLEKNDLKSLPFVVKFFGQPARLPVYFPEAPMFAFTPEDLIKVLIAVAIGGVIGFERELHSKAAGLRTITLITIGSTLFTILSAKFADPASSRVASNIVTGVGFLGAGVILFAEGKLKGLTTASSIWAAAALGMAVGVGDYVLAVTATFVVVIVLGLFARFDQFVDRIGRETRTYEIVYPARGAKHEELEALYHDCGLRVRNRKRMKRNGEMISVWELEGRARDHFCLAEKLLADNEIKELKY